MFESIKEYIQTGLSITRRSDNKYDVFTLRTQQFTVDSLDDLTPEAFANAEYNINEAERIYYEELARANEEWEDGLHERNMEELRKNWNRDEYGIS